MCARSVAPRSKDGSAASAASIAAPSVARCASAASHACSPASSDLHRDALRIAPHEQRDAAFVLRDALVAGAIGLVRAPDAQDRKRGGHEPARCAEREAHLRQALRCDDREGGEHRVGHARRIGCAIRFVDRPFQPRDVREIRQVRGGRVAFEKPGEALAIDVEVTRDRRMRGDERIDGRIEERRAGQPLDDRIRRRECVAVVGAAVGAIDGEARIELRCGAAG